MQKSRFVKLRADIEELRRRLGALGEVEPGAPPGEEVRYGDAASVSPDPPVMYNRLLRAVQAAGEGRYERDGTCFHCFFDGQGKKHLLTLRTESLERAGFLGCRREPRATLEEIVVDPESGDVTYSRVAYAPEGLLKKRFAENQRREMEWCLEHGDLHRNAPASETTRFVRRGEALRAVYYY